MTTESAPLHRDDLVAFFERAIRPGQTLIGTEQEKFGFVLEGDRRVPIDYPNHIGPLLELMRERFGWRVGYDKGLEGETVMLERDNASITLEPGGQFELSGAPLATVHETCAEFSNHFEELDAVAKELGLSFTTCGFHPFATLEQINWMPKGRYKVMRAYLPQHGARALDMMTRTCTVQANMDYGSEAECGRRLRTALAISPALTAAFANSPLYEGRVNGLQSNRNEVWEEVDPDRCGLPAFLFDEDFSFEKYIDWALATPMFFIKRDGAYIAHHRPFADFLAEGLVGPNGTRHRASFADWELHLSTLFPEVRIKPFIEVRGVDSVGSRFVCALPALLKGLLYDDASCQAAWELVGPYDHAGRMDLWRRGRRQGIHDPEILASARGLVALAREALDRMAVLDSKGRTEARFLDPLEASLEAGASPGDLAMQSIYESEGATAENFDARTPAGRDAAIRAFLFAGVEP